MNSGQRAEITSEQPNERWIYKHGRLLCCLPRHSERTFTCFWGSEAGRHINPGPRASAPPPFPARGLPRCRHGATVWPPCSGWPRQVAGRPRAPGCEEAAASCTVGFWLRRGNAESETAVRNAVTVVACLVGHLLWAGGAAGCLGKSREHALCCEGWQCLCDESLSHGWQEWSASWKPCLNDGEGKSCWQKEEG